MRRYTVAIDGRTFTLDVSELAADRFEVTVDGRTFDAELRAEEDLPGADITPGLPQPAAGRPVAPAAPSQTRAPAPARVPEATPPAVHPPGPTTPPARADVLAAPMPGVVLEVLVRPGHELARGDPLLVLEAMKMRNTIRAPRPAVVVEVAVEAGQPVAPGDPLVRLGHPGG